MSVQFPPQLLYHLPVHDPPWYQQYCDETFQPKKKKNKDNA